MPDPTPTPPPPPGQPSSPRSPRPTTPINPRIAAAMTPIGGADFVPQPPPRPNITSMLFLTAFFFFMSGNNNPPIGPGVEIGPDGEIVRRLSELELARQWKGEWQGVANGTLPANYTQPTIPAVIASSLIPPEYDYSPSPSHSHPQQFFQNITGFYRGANVHPISLEGPIHSNKRRKRDVEQEQDSEHLPSSASGPSSSSTFWRHVHLPELGPSFNKTLAEEMRGTWNWESTTRWDMNIKERNVSSPVTSCSSEWISNTNETYSDWTWVKGSLTLTSIAEQTIDYVFYGLHFKQNGTYELYALPDGMRVDIRNIPSLFPTTAGVVGNETKGIILRELEKEVQTQENLLMLSEVRADDVSETTTCPLLIHLALPPLPQGTTLADIQEYERELHTPTGIRSSLSRPPRYWETANGLGGAIVADQCGWALGIEGGRGIAIDDFWRKSVNYAAYATISQLLVLLLLVNQMEATRTPSTLSKVSLWTIIIMSISDSWIFSAHVVVGIMSDNGASLPMLVPGFLCLCTAVVFGPRYAVLLHRIQAPERTPTPPPVTPLTARPAAQAGQPDSTGATTGVTNTTPSVGARLSNLSSETQELLHNRPGLRWIIGLATLFLVLQVAFLPPVVPFFLFAMYSFWLPQIWRNARRGSSRAMSRGFVLGTAVGRMALPLYAFACPDNVFFVQTKSWIWLVIVWQIVQIIVLFAQERFGPAFFLPKSLAPPESYNYHPLIPLPDPENPSPLSGLETTCSICMEEVDLSPSSSAVHGSGASASTLGGLGDKRRSYALAPCGHVFHTRCLAQWMAVKTICPLCKRSLPPL